MILIDTDVLIDYLRDLRAAGRFLEQEKGPMAVSVVSVAELYAGARGEEEEAAIESLLGALHLFEVSRVIAQQAGRYRAVYHRSHGVELPDAIIAATAVAHHARLATLNQRHYPMLDNVLVPYRK